MILIYRPESGDEERWDLKQTRATFAEAKAAEARGGFKWAELEQLLQEGHLGALQAALWVFRKRSEPTLRFEDLEDLSLEAVDVQYSPAELDLMRTALKNDPEMDEEARKVALTLLGGDDTAEEAGAGAGLGGDDEGPVETGDPKDTGQQQALPEAG